MTRLIRRKFIVFITLVLALVFMLATCANRIDEDEFKGSERVIASNQESEPTTDPTPPPTPHLYDGDLELPVIGATGYTSIALDLKIFSNSDSETIEILKAGTAFEIVEEEGNWW